MTPPGVNMPPSAGLEASHSLPCSHIMAATITIVRFPMVFFSTMRTYVHDTDRLTRRSQSSTSFFLKIVVNLNGALHNVGTADLSLLRGSVFFVSFPFRILSEAPETAGRHPERGIFS